MKAYVVSKYKSLMQAGEVAEPAVGERDVLVDVRAAGVNMLDAKTRDGEFKLFLPYKAPFILGHDLAGIVTRVGSAATRFTVGDEVYARPRDGRIGTFAERIAVHEDDLAIKPANLSHCRRSEHPRIHLPRSISSPPPSVLQRAESATSGDRLRRPGPTSEARQSCNPRIGGALKLTSRCSSTSESRSGRCWIRTATEPPFAPRDSVAPECSW